METTAPTAKGGGGAGGDDGGVGGGGNCSRRWGKLCGCRWLMTPLLVMMGLVMVALGMELVVGGGYGRLGSREG